MPPDDAGIVFPIDELASDIVDIWSLPLGWDGALIAVPEDGSVTLDGALRVSDMVNEGIAAPLSNPLPSRRMGYSLATLGLQPGLIRNSGTQSLFTSSAYVTSGEVAGYAAAVIGGAAMSVSPLRFVISYPDTNIPSSQAFGIASNGQGGSLATLSAIYAGEVGDTEAISSTVDLTAPTLVSAVLEITAAATFEPSIRINGSDDTQTRTGPDNSAPMSRSGFFTVGARSPGGVNGFMGSIGFVFMAFGTTPAATPDVQVAIAATEALAMTAYGI